MPDERYTRNELRVLWYLKRHGPMVLSNKGSGNQRYSLVGKLGYETHIKSPGYVLNQLEARCLILRTYLHGKAKTFVTQGHNPIIKIELVDPGMWLPPLPPNPPAVVIMQENEELLERTAQEPSMESVLIALLERNEELQAQINKLCDIITKQEQELEKLKKEAHPTRKHVPERLTQRIQDALTLEKWEQLRHD